jgi:hypothetical protein
MIIVYLPLLGGGAYEMKIGRSGLVSYTSTKII